MIADVSRAVLERFRAALQSGRLPETLNDLALESLGARGLTAFLGMSRGTVSAIVEAVLAERAAVRQTPQLVWTGPDARGSAARDTAVALQELFGRAQQKVVVAGFRFDHGATLLAELHAAMKTKGVSCRLFADTEGADAFVHDHWPFGPPFPEVFKYVSPAGVFSSLHAKCVIVDSRHVLVTSANFTDRGQTRNIEVGVVLDDPSIAVELEQQLQGALAGGAFVRADATAR